MAKENPNQSGSGAVDIETAIAEQMPEPVEVPVELQRLANSSAAKNKYNETIAQQLGVKKDPKEKNTGYTDTQRPANLYGDISGIKKEYSPNEEGYANTGSGIESAIGTDYTWNKQSESKAQAQYQADVLAQEQNMLTNRQTLANNAINYQTQADMMKYQSNQNADKVGWTGGYVLDQNRQNEYLKQSIQAQMYGAMELQKYGYDSALAAARLSYDLNQQEYARQYYQDAVSASLSEAQLTGVYFSAETKDMMSQLAVAEKKLEENPRDKQALSIKNTIENWFQSNNISKAGVKTLEAWQYAQSAELQWSQEIWKRYNSILEATNADIANDQNKFIMLDPTGKEMWDGTNVEVGDWTTMNTEELTNYLLYEGTDGKETVNKYAMSEFYGYIKSQIEGQITAGYRQYCKENKYITTDSNNNEVIGGGVNKDTLYNYIKESGIVDSFLSKYMNPLSEESDLIKEAIDKWDFSFTMPNGVVVNYGKNELPAASSSEGPENHPESPQLQPKQLNISYENSYADEGKITIGSKKYTLAFDFVGVTNASIRSRTATDFYNTYANKGLEWEEVTQKWNELQNYLNERYTSPQNFSFAYDNENNLWMYYDGRWGYVEEGRGNIETLKKDITEFNTGAIPEGWAA